MNPTVSVVMAAKNYARFLPQAIESLLAQTVHDWELVIIDDGSTDETPTVALRYLDDERIHYHRSDKLGQSRAKNLGIGLSRAPIIAFLDADDAWLPTKLHEQLAVMNAQPEVGVCFCARKLMDENGTVTTVSPKPINVPRGWVAPAIFEKNFVCFSSAMVRRQVFEHVGMFDPELDLSIDYDLWLRVARHYPFEYVDQELVLYRTGHGNLSKKLADRVATATSIMNRNLRRRGLDQQLSRTAIGEGYASTFRALAYTLRPSEPWQAFRWYWQALQWPGRRRDAIKGMLASVVLALFRNPMLGSAENASVNR